MSTSQRYDTQNACASPTAAVTAVHQAISLDSPPTVRQYFEKVREMVKSGVQFPVQLSDVWHLIYTRKGDAIRSLKNDFEEGFDFQSLSKIAKRGIGATTSYEYTLTVPCMEFFIARKVRAVFDVYREVFHWVADNTVSVSQIGMVKLVNDLTEKVIGLESKIKRMHKAQEEYLKAVVVDREKLKVESDALRVDKESKRYRAMEMISKYIARYGCYHSTWNEVWRSLGSAYNLDVNWFYKQQKPGEHLLDTAFRLNLGQPAWEVIFSKYAQYA